MKELLELCGFGSADMDRELPRVARTFDKLGINDEDIARAKQRLDTYFDIEMEGIRKGLKIYVLELVDLMLAREEGKKKLLYGFMTSRCFETISYALMAKSEEIYSARIGFMFHRVLGYIFGKMVPVYEAAERVWVKAGGVTHCGNVKSVVGLYALDRLPRPDMMVTAGFLCETAPKTVGMIHEFYGIPTGYYDTCQDVSVKESPEAAGRTIDFAVKSMKRFVEKVQEVVGFEITDEMLMEAIRASSKIGEANRKLGELLLNCGSVPVRPTSEMLVGSFPVKMADIPKVIDAVDTLYEEVQARIKKGVKVVQDGAPRILTTHPLHSTDPRMEHLITELGITLVRPGFGPPAVEIRDGEEDPYVLMAGRGAMGGVSEKIDMIVESCRQTKVDGLLDVYHAGCRTMVGDALIIKEAVEKEVGIPVLLMEWENFDSRVYNHKQYKRRLEVFRTMMENYRLRAR